MPDTRPSEQFAKIIEFVRYFARIVGGDYYDPNYRFNVVTGLSTGAIVAYIIFTVTTVLKVYKENWMFLVEACCMSGSVFQGLCKLVLAIFARKRLRALYRQVLDIYELYERETDPRYGKVLIDTCGKLIDMIKLLAIFYLVGAIGVILAPLVASHLTGNHYLIMHFHLPYVSVDTQLGLWLTNAVHCVCVVLGANGLFAGDLTIAILLLQPFVFADIMRLKVDHLNVYVESSSIGSHNHNESKQLLVDIATWYQVYSGFVINCNDIMFTVVYVQVFGSAACIVCTIFALLTSVWPGGYSYLAIAIPNMYLYCILGTMLEKCNDDFMYEIYNISFYQLNVSQQRLVLLLIIKSQNPDMLKLLSVMPLSVSSALAITKFIYSSTMMMINIALD